MKAQLKVSRYGWFFLMLFLLGSCTKNDDVNPGEMKDLEQTDGISEEEIEEYKGDIGLLIDTREIAKKGYQPAKAVITVDANSGDYSRTVQVDEFTNLGQLLIEVSDLSADAKNELSDGVPVVVEIFDAGENKITSDSFSKVSFKMNGTRISIKTDDLEDINSPVKLKEGIPHFIQLVTPEDGVSKGWVISVSSYESPLQLNESHFDVEDYELMNQFAFEAIPNTEGIYAIHDLRDNKYLCFYYPFFNDLNNYFTQSDLSYPQDLSQLPDYYKFLIKRAGVGVYTICNLQGMPLRYLGSGFGSNFVTTTENEIVHVRLISLEIDWEFESIGTKYLQPIYPAAETSFGFNSTLINCGTGALQQEVGIERTIETTTRVGWEESLSVSSRSTQSFSVTVGAEVEANFFGSKTKAYAESTETYEFSREATRSNTAFGETSVTESNTYFSKRTIEVPPKSASLVFDAYQIYSNVEIPFVQRFRIKAKEKITGASLTGAEISSQLLQNGFQGVITETGSDYAEVSVRGTTTLDNMVKTQSEVQDVNPQCN